MSADRTVAVGEYGHSKVRCDGYSDGRRCCESVTGGFRKGIKGARSDAESRGWQVGVRQEFVHQIHDYCPSHARRVARSEVTA